MFYFESQVAGVPVFHYRLTELVQTALLRISDKYVSLYAAGMSRDVLPTRVQALVNTIIIVTVICASQLLCHSVRGTNTLKYHRDGENPSKQEIANLRIL